jgi:hypothetical protein
MACNPSAPPAKRPFQKKTTSLTLPAKQLNLGTAGSLANLPRREEEN